MAVESFGDLIEDRPLEDGDIINDDESAPLLGAPIEKVRPLSSKMFLITYKA